MLVVAVHACKPSVKRLAILEVGVALHRLVPCAATTHSCTVGYGVPSASEYALASSLYYNSFFIFSFL